MKDYALGTKWTREYKGKKVTIKRMKQGYAYNGETYNSLTAATKAIGTSMPPSIFFKSSAKSGAKRGRKPKSNNSVAQVTQSEAPAGDIRSMIADAVRTELHNVIAEEVRTAVGNAFRSNEAN